MCPPRVCCSGPQTECRRRSSAAVRSRSDASEPPSRHLTAARRGDSDSTDDADSAAGDRVPSRDDVYRRRRADERDLYDYKVAYAIVWAGRQKKKVFFAKMENIQLVYRRCMYRNAKAHQSWPGHSLL